MKTIALLFAGQGAQSVGMGHDLAEQFPGAAELFQQADEILGRKLSEIAWNGPIEELTKTSNCQPALFVHGLACLSALRELAGDFPIGGAAGLSLGEITAHAAGGTFDFVTGLKLVQRRGVPLDEVQPGNKITQELKRLIMTTQSGTTNVAATATPAPPKKLKMSWAR